jgi:D-alanyl-D-alanine carboxypeptidase (penicillin-binding protein 5/6)
VEGSILPSVELEAVRTVSYPLAEHEMPQISVEYPEKCSAPVETGAVLGRVIWTLDGAVIGQTELAVAAGCGFDRVVEPPSRFRRLWTLLNGWR